MLEIEIVSYKLNAMNVSRFALFAGALWGLGTLLIISISIMSGDKTGLIELDFRPLTATFMIAAYGLETGTYVSWLADYAENGLPLTVVSIALAFVLALIDGFASGWLIAFIYNYLVEKKKFSAASAFGTAAGIVLAICSGLLAQVVLTCSLDIGSFDHSVRPVSFLFLLLSKAGLTEYVSAVRESYATFPKSGSGVLLWALWGFADGYIGGLIVYYIYTMLRGLRGGAAAQGAPKT